MSENLDGHSIRQFARLEGCSEALVRQRIKKGYLPTLRNGRISEEMVGTPWRTGAAPGGKPAARRRGDETPEQAAERIVFREGRVFETEAEAKRHKESYLALLRELEYDRESGRVVEIEESIRQIGQEYAAVRSRLLAIPAKAAPRVLNKSNPEEVRALIEAEIVEAMRELTLDAGGGPK